MSYSVACTSAAATLTGLSPASGSVGNTVTLTGTAFHGASAVSFGGTAATSFTVNSATSITATVPSLALGAYNVTVTTDAGTTGAVSFDVTPTFPDMPVIGTATAGDTQATVSFSPPASDGGATVTGYTVTASPGGATGTGPASAITVTGLSNGTAYSFTVTATNSVGAGPASAASNSVTPQGAQAIAFTNPGAQVLGTSPTLTATADSGLAPTFSSGSASVCTITSGGTLSFVSVGSCSIHADQAGDASHLPAPRVSQSFAVDAAGQAISFGAQAAQRFVPNGTFALNPEATASSGLPVSYTAQNADVCTISGATVTMRSAGTCTIAADQAGDGDHDAAAQTTVDVVIDAAMPTLAWIGELQRTIGEGAFDLADPSSSSTGAFTFTSSDTSVATISGRTVTVVGAGTTTLMATQAATGNYRAGEVTAVLTIAARPDPTRDAEVTGGLQAQVDASVRFAAAQQGNIQGRLRQLRNSDGNPSSHGLALGLGGGHGSGLTLPAGPMAQSDTVRLPPGWGVWSAGVITVGEREANGASGGWDIRSDGVTLGFDRSVGAGVLGIAGGIGWNDSEAEGSTSRIDADQRSLAAYGLWRGEHWFVDGLLGIGRLSFDIARWSDVAGATAAARRDGEQGFGALGAGYAHAVDAMTLTGYGRVDASRTTLDAYRESGLGIHDLDYGDQTIENSTVAVGIEGSHRFEGASVDYRPFWSLEYRSELQDRSTVGINYVLMPVASDYVLGLRSYRGDALVFGAGVDMQLRQGWTLSLLFRREQASEATANTFGLRLSSGHGGRAMGSVPGLEPGRIAP